MKKNLPVSKKSPVGGGTPLAIHKTGPMKMNSPAREQTSEEEISSLVQNLRRTERRLQELTVGEVDAVIHPGGHAYLLHKAQEKLRHNETAMRHLVKMQMAILNALPAHIALLDENGVIMAVNEAWKQLATANALQGPEHFVTQNYIEICERAKGCCSEEAQSVARGIRQVLSGETDEFSLEYACHSSTEKHWFHLTVTPVQEDSMAGAVVMHLDITERKLAEEELQRRQTELQVLFDLMPAMLWFKDTKNTILRANRQAAEAIGKSVEEIEGKPTSEIFPDAAAKFHADDLAVMQAGVPLLGEVHKYPNLDGQEGWFQIDKVPVRGKDGTVTGIVIMVQNITERKLAEKQANEQMELMNMASRVGKLGAWAIEFPGPKIVWSEEVYRIHEVEPDFKPDLETALDFFAPASRNKLEKAVQSGVPYDLELDLITAKGNRRCVRTTSAIEVKNGVTQRLYGIFQDLTDRKRTESRFRALVDSNVQGVLFWNRNGVITEANDAFFNIVGYTRKDLNAGLFSWVTLTPKEYAHLDRRCLEEIDAQGFGTPYEKEYIRKDGSRVPILLGAACFEDNPNEGVCYVIDLTERKKLEQQFFRAQRMEGIGTLAGGIAHDLNNILAPIMMSIHILKDAIHEPEAMDVLDTIEISAKRGADIVRQVLSFARGLEGERIEVQPKHLLKDLENIIKDTFPKDIRMLFSNSEDTWPILGDPTQVHQILLNLCVNARDAMPNGGTLSIGVENRVIDEHYAAMNLQAKVGRYVQISVTDSGTGMPADILDKIFEPFFTTKEVGKGTGLGLSTVIALVKSHEGFVNVYSEPGKGTTFRVYLPAMEASPETKKLTQQVSASRGNGEVLLLVDDETSILTVTSKTLQAFGYRVLTAVDGADALAVYLAHKHEIAAVITDMMMPIMDGPATIHALMRINPAAKIIAVSGLNANGGMVKASEAGVKHFLTKPYTAGALLKTVRTLLDEK